MSSRSLVDDPAPRCVFQLAHFKRAGVNDAIIALAAYLNLTRSYSCALVPPTPASMINNVVNHNTSAKTVFSRSWDRYLSTGPGSTLDDILSDVPESACKNHSALYIFNRVPKREELMKYLVARAGGTAGASGEECIPFVKVVHTTLQERIFWLNGFDTAYIAARCQGESCSIDPRPVKVHLSSELLSRAWHVIETLVGANTSWSRMNQSAARADDDSPARFDSSIRWDRSGPRSKHRIVHFGSPARRPAVTLHVRRGDALHKHQYYPYCVPDPTRVARFVTEATAHMDPRTVRAMETVFVFTDETSRRCERASTA